MAKIDRLGWAAGLSISAYGLRIGIRVNDRQSLPAVSACLPAEWTPLDSPIVDVLYSVIIGGAGGQPGVRRFNLIYSGAARLARTMEVEEAFTTLETSLKLFVAEWARRRVFVHAGVVGWNGRAILIPGRSFSGKSSLVAELVKAGATYCSDEYAVLDGAGRVHPYARPLSLRRENEDRPERLRAEDLGGVAETRPLRVGMVVVTRYEPDGQWRPRERSVGQGIIDLFSHTVPARRKPKAALAALRRVASEALILKGKRGEAELTANDILNRMPPRRRSRS
jgi:hypothetical protein